VATLTAWKFDTPDGAARAEQILTALSEQDLIRVHDAARVEWERGKRRPKTHHDSHLAGEGALGGAFWGLLFGILFFIPLLGLAIGTAAGAVGGALSDAGISDDFIKAVKDEVTPGTSALFLLSSDAVLDEVREAFAEGPHPVLISTTLTGEDEARLRAAFADES
jgi:uncharacterized membrane protein